MTEQASDKASGAYDSAASSLQPGMVYSGSTSYHFFINLTNNLFAESEKSTSQKASDTLGSGGQDTKDTGKSYMQTAQDTASDAATKVSDTLSGKLGSNFLTLFLLLISFPP